VEDSLVVVDLSFNAASPDGLESDDESEEELDDESLDPPALDFAAGLASRASFLAQPLPLKTMAGVESSLRMGPPQRSHAVGPLS